MEVELPFPPLPARSCAPRQQFEHQIPIYTYDVHSDAEEFNRMNVVREQRLLAMAPASFMGIPITLLSPNPETGHSHHILRLINSWVVENRAADLLFKDENVYFIAFRRVTDGVGGQWYKFDGEDVPDFLNAENIRNLDSSHESAEDTKIGGTTSLDSMFQTFYHFHGQEVDTPLVRAKARAIVFFSEALRFMCVRREVAGRITNNEEATRLPGKLWNRMLFWQVFSDFLLDTMRRFALPEGHPSRQPDQARLARFAAPYDIFQLGDLIGPNGDIRLILRRQNLMITSANLERRRRQPGAAHFQDPRFNP